MLLSLVAELDLARQARLPATHGEAMQRELFRQIGVVAPGGDGWFHGEEEGALRYYTVSPLMGRFEFSDGSLLLQPGETYWFRLTGLGKDACRLLLALTERCRRWELRGVSFAAPFAVRRWITEAGNRGRATWAGCALPEEFWTIAQRDAALQSDRIHLRFYSPTVFVRRSGSEWGRWNHLPQPETVFQSARNRLLAAYPDCPEPPNWSEVLVSGLALGRFELNTRILSFDKHHRSRAGFVGDCEFLIHPDLAPPERLWLHLLAGMAMYTGLGSGASWGMGQVRREPVEQFHYRGPFRDAC